ncbi:hypothetical protein AAY473_011856 [Plecturocebus cupreus]
MPHTVFVLNDRIIEEAQHFGRPRQADHLRSRVQDQSGQDGKTPVSIKNTKISWAWWHTPVIPDAQEAKAQESLEPRRQRLVAHFARPRQEDLMRLGVGDQPGQHGKTLSLQKKNFKLARCGGTHLWPWLLERLRWKDCLSPGIKAASAKAARALQRQGGPICPSYCYPQRQINIPSDGALLAAIAIDSAPKAL